MSLAERMAEMEATRKRLQANVRYTQQAHADAERRAFRMLDSYRKAERALAEHERAMMQLAGMSADDIKRVRDYTAPTLANGRF